MEPGRPGAQTPLKGRSQGFKLGDEAPLAAMQRAQVRDKGRVIGILAVVADHRRERLRF